MGFNLLFHLPLAAFLRRTHPVRPLQTYIPHLCLRYPASPHLPRPLRSFFPRLELPHSLILKPVIKRRPKDVSRLLLHPRHRLMLSSLPLFLLNAPALRLLHLTHRPRHPRGLFPSSLAHVTYVKGFHPTSKMWSQMIAHHLSPRFIWDRKNNSLAKQIQFSNSVPLSLRIRSLANRPSPPPVYHWAHLSECRPSG